MLEWPSSGCSTSPDPTTDPKTASATAVFVVYATSTLDLDWLPDAAEIIVVHNDDSFDRTSIPGHHVVHLDAGRNLGFGAAVNLALEREHVTTERVVLCNPDVVLTLRHWEALVDAEPDDIVTIPLVDSTNRPTAVTSRYPNAASHLASGYRLGRFAPRGGRARRVLGRGLGAWGRAHDESLHEPVGTWSLRERWVSGAVMSIDTARLRAVGGFDDRYFLYYEDVDLCRRLARRFPSARAVVADVTPGLHRVGGSSTADTTARAAAEHFRLASALRYAHEQPGLAWRTCETLLGVRAAGAS